MREAGSERVWTSVLGDYFGSSLRFVLISGFFSSSFFGRGVKTEKLSMSL